MFTKKHFINNFSAAFLLFIGALFIFKYSSRYGNIFVLSPILYIVGGILLLSFINKKITSQKNGFSKGYLISIVGAIAVVALLLAFIPQSTRVGRFPAMVEWLSNFQQGIFPYGTKTNPSGFPFLFFLASPFYLLDDAGYLEVFGLFLFLVLLLKSIKTKKEYWVKMLLLLFLPTTFYELIVRSELLTNAVLVISLFFLAEQKLNENKKNISFIVLALLFGFFLSTRLIVFLWLAMFLLFFFRNNLKNGVIFFTISLSVFLLSLLPFYLWNAETFLSKGPFAVQTIYLPKWIYFVFPLLVLYIGWMIADFQELLFASGVLTFLLVSISFLMTIGHVGMGEALFNSRFDISYYIFSVPFFILALKEYKVDWFLGKVFIS
ncbi:MAG: hypothetical protein M0Q21_05580 [Ignavibacteriaceae bacterium]|nr:hypothetical protein [Ignavibacteriaceae bacterium]